MSITKITEPQTATPVYNDLIFIADSSNKNKTGFRYLADLYINGSKLHSYRIFPTRSNYGMLNCSKIVSSYLTSQATINNKHYDGISNNASAFIQVKWGEEYYADAWTFAGYNAATSSNWTNYSDLSYNPDGLPKTMIYNSTATATPYAQGDYIRITQTSVNRPEIEGIFRVLDTEYVNSGGVEYMVVLELAWIGTGTASSGTVAYANNEKTQNLNQLTSSTINVFNGVLPFETFKDWDYTDYALSNLSSKILTNAPRKYTVRPDSVVYLNLMNTSLNLTGILMYNPNDDYNGVISTSSKFVTANASPSLLSGVDYYDFYAVKSGGSHISEPFRINIDTKCYTYGDIEIIFLDRLGSILPFQFTRADTDVNVSREVSKVDIIPTLMYGYSLLENGSELYNIEEDKTLTLTTTRLNNEMAIYFRELVTSGWTAIRFGSGKYVRCNIDTSSYRLKDQFTDGLKTYEIKIKYSNKDVINW